MQNLRAKKRRSTKSKPPSRFRSLKDYLAPKPLDMGIKPHAMNSDIENSVFLPYTQPFEVQNVARRNKWLDRGNIRDSFENLMEVLHDKQKGIETKNREKFEKSLSNKKADDKRISEEIALDSDGDTVKAEPKPKEFLNDTTQEETFNGRANVNRNKSSSTKKLVSLLSKAELTSSNEGSKQIVSDSQLYRIKAKRTSYDLDALLEAKDNIIRNRRQSNIRPQPQCRVSKHSKNMQTDNPDSSKSKKLDELLNETRTHAYDINAKNQIIEEKDDEIRTLNYKLQELMNKLIENENQRKALNMELQQTKGNIRIFCRVKPRSRAYDNIDESKPLVQETRKIVKVKPGKITKKPKETSPPNPAPETNFLEIIDQGDRPRMLSIIDPDTQKKRNYFFDRVFTDHSKQIDVFNELEGYVTAAYDGGKIVIFAYGQTGSGKTYTLQGGSTDSGVLPRSLEKLLDMRNRDHKLLDNISISFSVLEIYNEKLIDLLDPRKDNLNIQVKNNTVHLSNLSKVSLDSYSQLDTIIQAAASNRNIEKTAFNDESSRSHCLYRIKITKTDFDGRKTKGLLNIIDLAGCERFSDDIEDPQRLKKVQTEANFINKSLTTLGRILRIKKENRVNGCNKNLPIRETKLTRVLQDCMDDEEAVTLMIVNVCQDESTFSQTRETLNFSVINV